MKRLLATMALCMAWPGVGLAQQYDFSETNPRVWTDREGETEVTAKLIAYNRESGQVVLQDGEEAKIEMQKKDLSMNGRRYLTRQVKKADRLAKRSGRSISSQAKAATRNKAREEAFVLNTGQSSTAQPTSDGVQRLYNISWQSTPESATALAKNNEGVSDDKPIMWFRVLGDLSGYM